MRKPTGADPRKRKGLIIVHTGEGKGKSTAAFGLAMRAAGNKMNVFIMQFMKGPWKAGERKAFDLVKGKLNSGKFEMVIFEEINYVLDYKFLPEDEVLETIRNKPKMTHVVCTGRNASKKLIEMADLVTEMKMIKHPFAEQGIPAQKGIEF